MNFLMFLIAVAYTCMVVAISRVIVVHMMHEADGEVLKAKEAYQLFFKRKMDIYARKKRLEEKASEIYTLYDMTKEIAKNFNEEDALKIFCSKLRENVSFEDCQLVRPGAADIKKYREDEKYFLYLLKGRRQVLGHLAIKGVADRDKEKVTILAQQFSLVLRRIRLYEEIESLAMTDSLTAVHTRRYLMSSFKEEFKRAKARKTPLSFLMIDVDYFKHFNDQYGHLTGDMILREIATQIRAGIREIDIVGRYGGEEFCVILPDTGHDEALYVAERIRSQVEKKKIKAYDSTVRATVSIGLVSFPDGGKNVNDMIEKADWALYRAKKKGRNVVCAFGFEEKK